MSDRISIPGLRVYLGPSPENYEFILRGEVVAALLDVAEAARYLRSGAASDVGALVKAQRAFDQALTRFDFEGAA